MGSMEKWGGGGGCVEHNQRRFQFTFGYGRREGTSKKNGGEKCTRPSVAKQPSSDLKALYESCGRLAKVHH